jgi:hypothetical protein
MRSEAKLAHARPVRARNQVRLYQIQLLKDQRNAVFTNPVNQSCIDRMFRIKVS